MGLELTMLVVIGTECTDNWKSNCHMMVPGSTCTDKLTYLLSPCYASWHIGQGQVSSTLLCCCLLFLLAPGVSSFLYFIFDDAPPCCFWSSLFLFPSGVHLRATFVMSSDGLRRTWPSHLHLFWINKVSMS